MGLDNKLLLEGTFFLTAPWKVCTSMSSEPFTVCCTYWSRFFTIQLVPEPESNRVLTLKDLSPFVVSGTIKVGDIDMTSLFELM